MNSPRGTSSHTTSKGGRAKSKGEDYFIYKGDQGTGGWLYCSADHHKPTSATASWTCSQSWSPQANMQSSVVRPNYISQDEDNDPTHERCTTRSQSIMQEAMLSCINITNPPCKISPSQLSQCKFPMKRLCKMANLLIGDNWELLEYLHLIASPKTKAVWVHLYGKKLSQLAHGMPGKNMGTDTIVFIHCNQVPRDRTKAIIYSLITCLVQPEKVAQGNREHY